MAEDCDWESILQQISAPLDPSTISKRHGMMGEEAPEVQGVVTSSQFPTPPQSPTDEPPSIVVGNAVTGDTIVAVSTSFHPGANHQPLPPDLAVLSTDSVFFYVHTHVLLSASSNGFRSTLPLKPREGSDAPALVNDLQFVVIQEESPVLNIILHTVYGMSCTHYAPPFDLLVTAIDKLPAYGMNPKLYIMPGTPLYAHLLTHAAARPLELYALAAFHDLYELAIPASSHLLSFNVYNLPDPLAERMGGVYLKRLVLLQVSRMESLKRVLVPPPQPHLPTRDCDFEEQKKVTRAWALASAYLIWDAVPDLTLSTVELAFRPLGDHLTCDLCRRELDDRIKLLISQWSMVKRTI